ncbi:hypothetical protein [Amorphus sp. MBR-141]
MGYQPLLLQLELKYELEDAGRDVIRLQGAIKRWCKAACHVKRGVSLLIVTDESSETLVERLRPTLESISSIDNWRCYVAPSTVTCRNGTLDTLATRCHEAWLEAGQRNKPKHVSQPKSADAVFLRRGIKEDERRAVVKMSVKPRGMRQTPENTNS